MSASQNITYCPFCKEAIKPGAVKCRFCGSTLGSTDPLVSVSRTDTVTLIKNALKGRYEIISLIGKGGMASVYKARQVSLGRVVALKVIHPNLIHDQEFVERFLQEARVCAKLSHYNIINIYDFGEAGGIYYMSMEYLKGDDLSEIIKKNKRIKPIQAKKYLSQIANALNYIHKRGFVHRDVKSSNIFITKEGRPVLMDFGIAWESSGKHLTVAGTLLGTPQYLSPEQATGGKATPESDFYSLGVVFYECITGRVPFNDPNPMMVINKIIREQPIEPGRFAANLPKSMSTLVLELMHKNPRKRKGAIQTISGFSNDPVRKKRKQDPVLVNFVLLGALLILFIGMIGGIVFFANNRQTPVEFNFEYHPDGDSILLPPEERKGEKTPESNVIQMIESEIVELSDIAIMKSHVTQRLWLLVMNEETGGSNSSMTGISYNQVKDFLKKLNSIPGIPYRYSLPSLSVLIEGNGDGKISLEGSEWVNDPPEFPRGYRADHAKFYHAGFHDEAGELRRAVRNDIYFRLVRKLN